MHILVHTIDTTGSWRCTILTDLFIITFSVLSDQAGLDGLVLVHRAAHVGQTCLLSPT